MHKKLIAIMTMALLLVPAVGHAAKAQKDVGRSPIEICVPLPVATGAMDVHVGTTHVHVPGVSNTHACVVADAKVTGTPTVTPYANCGTACFAVRVADIHAYSDLEVDVRYREDTEEKSVTVDPDPVDVTRDLEEVCISNHDVGAPDPCVLTITSPSDLRARGGNRAVALRWAPGGEAYGRSVSPTYELWRSTSSDLESFELVTEGLAETSFVDTGLQRRTTYSYYVVAVDEKGNRSGGSNIATATTK